jgi:peptide/nickel transport system permease protein
LKSLGLARQRSHTETIFGLSGGSHFMKQSRLRIVQAFTVVIAVFFVVINLLVDLSYGYLDPRIHLE